MSRWRQFGFPFVVWLMAAILSGCVTTTTGAKPSIDKEKSLATRLQLTLGYIRQGNRDAARTNLNRARDINRSDPRIFNAEAMLYQLEGESELAEKAFRNAIRIDPGYSAARNNYGVFLASKGRLEEAIDQFDISGKDIEYERRDTALLNLGQTALKLGDEDKAKASLEHAVMLNRQLGAALIELAEIEFKLRNYSAAKEYIDRFEQKNKPSPRSLWLGIRLERIFGNKDKEASLVLALKNRYPYSNEYLEYKRLANQ
ncbi:type IV pilus biogenesis/stability protein PilW [Marinibactrum halimedae]|uniref:Type IV pilus biogenesis/stability protein PilW n=1 Tax=Marinibactrum halimedae TaxID=1444977 RepID=A0AA37T7K1_9GAMM|nr:type IV pilus biogenesis/stability protein PilW [Marinibactrum halimedae]MCD9458434.1 type IV pilus biogenesis/stability protein PilW [Marinibactrum halimedae]GLS26132.1 type IV pilus biogenesis/stability protein PilW [Marinibactrum halimedae]